MDAYFSMYFVIHLFHTVERKAQMEKMKAEDRKRKNAFRAKVEKKVSEFINDTTRTRLKFPPVDKIYRSIM